MVVVVGGHTRNLGKTSVVAGIIRALPELEWTALKITPHRTHDPGDNRMYVLTEEYEAGDRDSARFLKAGAKRAFWLRAAGGELHAAAPAIKEILSLARNTIVESNSIMELLRPDLYLMVVDFARNDFKASALRFMERADAFVVVGDKPDSGPTEFKEKPRFSAQPPDYASGALAAFVRAGG